MGNVKTTRLVKMSLRLSPKHMTALHALRDDDGISIQDHIRRALDKYLRTYRAAEPLPAPHETPLAPSPDPGVQSPQARTRRKVVFR